MVYERRVFIDEEKQVERPVSIRSTYLLRLSEANRFPIMDHGAFIALLMVVFGFTFEGYVNLKKLNRIVNGFFKFFLKRLIYFSRI